MTTDMKVKAIAPWFGGKRTMAHDIVQELGPHSQYFEPFCGSMAVLFAKEPSRQETVNDLHGDLINLARVISREESAERLYDRVKRTLFTEDLVQKAQRQLEESPLIDSICEETSECLADHRAYWYFLASWMGRNGVAGMERIDYAIAVRWTKGGGSPTIRWRNAVDSLPAWHNRLLNVVILKRDGFLILDRFEDVSETAVYVDPPYPAETRSKIKSRSGKYLHEFNHEDGGLFGGKDDHARLAEILRGYRKARVVVSSYDCPRIRELYEGWTFVDKARHKQLSSQKGRGSRQADAPEVLILNGPSYVR